MNSVTSESRPPTREDGFTIIELLVSLTILGVTLGLLAGGLSVLSHSWEAHAERIETLDMVSRAADILRRDVSGLQRVVAVRRESPRYLFKGTQDNLSFVTLEPPYPSAAGPYYVSYSVIPNGPNVDLIRARARYQRGLMAFPGATPANRVPLLQGPYRYVFDYADKSSGTGVWRNSWPYSTRLPDLIRLQIVNAKGKTPVAPPLVVAVRADAELSCLAEKAKVCSAKSGGELKGRQGESDVDNLKSKYKK